MHIESPTTTMFGTPIAKSRNSSVPDLTSLEKGAESATNKQPPQRFASSKTMIRGNRSPRRTESVPVPPLTSSAPSTFLFAKRESVFHTPVYCTTESILVGIIKLSVKSFMECIRVCTLGRHGYQQMQVDIEFMRRMLTDLLPDADAQTQILSALKEFEKETTERSISPIGMEPSVCYYFDVNMQTNMSSCKTDHCPTL